MKARTLALVAIALVLAAACCRAQAPAADTDVVAVVNGQEITRAALVDRLLNLTNTGRVALNEMIGETLLLQEAQKRNLTVTDQEIQDRIAVIKTRLADQDQQKGFANYLRDQNVTPAGLTYKLKVKLLAEKILADGIQVSDAEVDLGYDRSKGLYDRPETVVLRQIRMKTEADARAVLARLDKGESFAEVAKEVSTDLPSRQQGGLWAEVRKQDLPDQLQEPAFSTAVGKYTQPIKTNEGDWVILMVEGKRAAVKHDPQFVKDQLRIEIREHKLRAAWLELMKTLTQDSKKIDNKLGAVEP